MQEFMATVEAVARENGSVIDALPAEVGSLGALRSRTATEVSVEA
jgi:hypothetical protein